MQDQLPEKPNCVEIGIINFDGLSGPGTQWVSQAVDPRDVVYIYSYGFAPPREFLQYICGLSRKSVWYSTLPTQTLTDPPICGPEVIAVINNVSVYVKRDKLADLMSPTGLTRLKLLFFRIGKGG